MTPDRVLTQHALTGEWLTLALPVADLEYGPELSGPGSLSGKLSPRLVAQHPSFLDPGTTCIYIEAEGELRWGGLIWHAEPQGDVFTFEASGWSSYLEHRYDLDGNFNGRGPYTNADPCDVVRDIWEYAQSIADGDLGIVVDTTTSTAKVGTTAEPYKSGWWDGKSLGSHIDDLVGGAATPDYTCTVEWNADKSDVIKRIRLGWPRLGARRTDISFASGVNIVDEPTVPLAGDEYAQVIIAMGEGEGSAKRREVDAVRNGRLRLEYLADHPGIKARDVLKSKATAERKRRQILGSVDQITVRDTPAAPFGSWQVGDDVHVRIHNHWVDYVGWRRITGWTIQPHATGGPRAVISLTPADAYQYAGV